ncbi:MAG: ribosomal protein S18-alanine N-acetyltransferase [Fimbriimonadales bacterium]|nr:ribosomal protein S18-alanine N-acetyltransferase [Fimbriimonadales bacterium]
MMRVEMRPLDEGLLAPVLEIERASNPAPWSEASFRAEIGSTEGEFLVLLVDQRPVGFGGYWSVVDEAHITNVAVEPESRRQGWGRRIMEELLRRAANRGMRCSTLEVRASNHPAVRLYESLGYQAVARRRRYYPDNGEDALVMWLYDLTTWKT